MRPRPHDRAIASDDPPPDEVLRRGVPARAVVVRRRGSGLRNDDGLELHTLVLNVQGAGDASDRAAALQLTAVVALAAEEVDLVDEGAEVPIAVLEERGRVVAVDLARARAERRRD